MSTRTIGAAAAAAGLTPKAVRLYETRGLLPAPARTAAGYRSYTDDDVARLRFIAAARELGLRLDQVGDVLTAAHEGNRPCATTRALLRQRITEVDELTNQLRRLRTSLSAALDIEAPESTAGVCPLIEARPVRGARQSSCEADRHAPRLG